MLNIAIVGGAGFTGQELLRLLQSHPDIFVKAISSEAHEGQSVGMVFPHLSGNYSRLVFQSHEDVLEEIVDLFFLATPNDVSLRVVPRLLEKNPKVKVVDLSGSFRIADAMDFERYYRLKHPGKEWIDKRVYGLPEIYRQKISNSRFVANPGCYPTGALLALFGIRSYLSRLAGPIMIDAKSGASGAGGRVTTPGLGYVEVNETIKAYKVLAHQHQPEIQEQVNNFSEDCKAQNEHCFNVHFVPHLIPMNRGILSTIWLYFSQKMDVAAMRQALEQCFLSEPFVRVLPEGVSARTDFVSYTNQCHIQIDSAANEQMIVLTAVIDNLGKGAAGQAIQNANILLGLDEISGLV